MDHKERKDEGGQNDGTGHNTYEVKDHLSASHSREKRERVAERKKRTRMRRDHTGRIVVVVVVVVASAQGPGWVLGRGSFVGLIQTGWE